MEIAEIRVNALLKNPAGLRTEVKLSEEHVHGKYC